MKTSTQVLGWLVLPLLCGLCAGGCHSLEGPGSASFASVTIDGQSVGKIKDTAVDVFHESGYEAYTISEGLLFEKEGSRMNSIAYNGLIGTHEGAKTLIRVRAALVDLGAGSQRLQCEAFIVSNANDSFAEKESRIAHIRSGPYQDMLNEVAKRLKKP